MEKNNKCCIGILKWQLFREKEKMLKRLLLWDGGSIFTWNVIAGFYQNYKMLVSFKYLKFEVAYIWHL